MRSISADISQNACMTTPETPAGPDRRHLIGTGLGVLGGAAALGALTAPPAQAAANDGTFFPYGPIRVADSRIGKGTPASRISSRQTRTVSFSTYFPAGAGFTAILNLTVTGTQGGGYLTVWETGRSRPAISNISWFAADQTFGNMAIAGLRSSDRLMSVYCGGTGSAAHVIVDLVGFFYSDSPLPRLPAGVKQLPA